MWAYSLTLPRHFERVEVPTLDVQQLQPGQVLLRTLAGGICGSDLPGFAGELSPLTEDTGRYAADQPGFPMHEVVGEVVASRTPRLAEGSLVVGWATTRSAIAEYVVTEGDSLAGYDARLEPTTAVLLQPLACVLYAVDQLGPIEGRAVAVIGQGPIGILFSHVLKHRARAGRLTGVDPVDRSDVASAFGVDEMVQSTSERWAARLEEHDRPEVIVEAVGHQTETLGDAIEAVAVSGLVSYFGVPVFHPYAIDMWKLMRKQVTLKAGTTLSRSQYLVSADTYLAEHPLLAEQYATHRYPVAEVTDAYQTASIPAKGRLKVVVAMT
jgi:L-iditol 2-dehydrogenase